MILKINKRKIKTTIDSRKTGYLFRRIPLQEPEFYT